MGVGVGVEAIVDPPRLALEFGFCTLLAEWGHRIYTQEHIVASKEPGSFESFSVSNTEYFESSICGS